MCLIVASEKGSVPSESELILAAVENPHGFGAAWVENNRIKNYKSFDNKKLDYVASLIKGKPYILHFRWATHGDHSFANAHPFKVSKDLWVAHNGIISGLKHYDDTKSDTWHYVQKLKSEGVCGNNIEKRYKKFETFIGLGNKLTFLRSDGKIFISNARQGDWEDNIWYSNTNHRYDVRKYTYHGPITSQYSRFNPINNPTTGMLWCESCMEWVDKVYEYDKYAVCGTCLDMLEYMESANGFKSSRCSSSDSKYLVGTTKM